MEERKGKKLGRKPSASSGASHQAREEFSSRHPLHVTLKVADGLPSLRGIKAYRVILAAIRESCTRAGRLAEGVFRVVHYSVQGNHIHLIVEAGDLESLARGIGGLCTRIAKSLNKLWGRRGKVFPERYHARVLKTPNEVRNTIRYLYRNAEHHGRNVPPGWADPCSSVIWFDGFEDRRWSPKGERPVAEARTWLLMQGYRLAGPLYLGPQPAEA